MTDEIWKQFEETDYQISNYGKIKNSKTGRILKNSIRCGKQYINISKTKQRGYVHRLVYHYFCNFLYKNDIIIHIDGDCLNNYYKNLKLVTNVIPQDYKKCIKCNEIKHYSSFTKKKSGKYGVRTMCKSCEILHRQEIKNNPVLLDKRRKYNATSKLKNKHNPLDIVKRIMRGRLYDICRVKNIKKDNKTEKILGISFKEFKLYIENNIFKWIKKLS